MTRVWIFGLIFTAAGFAITAIAWWFHRSHRREVAPLIVGKGRVVRTEESEVDGQRMYQPVVEFQAGGATYTATDTAFHGASTWKPGDAHAVFFDPANPRDARLSPETGSQFGAQLFAMFGISFLAIGLIALVAYLAGEGTAFGIFVRDALS